MPTFKVITDSEGSYDSYTDDDAYRFNDHGLLVTIRSQTRERRTYSPNAWVYVEDTAPKSAYEGGGAFLV
jgi:hypothetical protein